jgi:hypothetical protein
MSPELEKFVRHNLATFEELEIWLRLQHSCELWSAPAVASELALTELDTTQALVVLAARGLLVHRTQNGVDEYGFPIWNRRLREMAELLEESYLARPLDVAKVLSAAAIARVRNAAIETFSDAFVMEGSPSAEGVMCPKKPGPVRG